MRSQGLRATELVQTEDRFNEVKDALKGLNKQDFDKLIASVRVPSNRYWLRPGD